MKDSGLSREAMVEEFDNSGAVKANLNRFEFFLFKRLIELFRYFQKHTRSESYISMVLKWPLLLLNTIAMLIGQVISSNLRSSLNFYLTRGSKISGWEYVDSEIIFIRNDR